MNFAKGDKVKVVGIVSGSGNERFIGKTAKVARAITDEPEHGVRYNLSFPGLPFYSVVFIAEELESA